MWKNRTSYRGRFAPSPTGPLHFGSLVAALGSYLDARSRHGQWLLRIEDLDPPREVPGAADDILRTLEAYGFEWDGEVQYQSRRQDDYREVLEHLLSTSEAYPCACTRREIAQSGTPGPEGPIYPGTCRNGLKPGKKALSIRLKTDSARLVVVEDRIQGFISQSPQHDIGDYVIRRGDGLFAYQLAVVVDDAWQNISHIVRGADLLASTPRQIHLQRLLGMPTPVYAHLPVVLDRLGRKLSKQDGARPVTRDNVLDTLSAAYTFLNQQAPKQRFQDSEGFWDWAIRHWDMHRVPVEAAARLPVTSRS